MRKRTSGVCSSMIVTMSVREGLCGPAFCALIVRNVREVFVEATAKGKVVSPGVSVLNGEERWLSVWVGPWEEGIQLGSPST